MTLLLLVSLLRNAISIATYIKNKSRWQYDKIQLTSAYPLIALEPIKSADNLQDEECMHFCAVLDSGEVVVQSGIGNRDKKTCFRARNLGSVAVADVILHCRIRFYGGNTPFSTSQEESLEQIRVGSLLPGEAKIISVSNACAFPVSIFLLSVSRRESDRSRTVVDFVSDWFGCLEGSDTEFRRDALLRSVNSEHTSTYRNIPAKRRAEFRTMPNCDTRTLALVVVEEGKDWRDIIFVATGYGESPVQSAETFVDSVADIVAKGNRPDTRYVAYFGSTFGDRRSIELLPEKGGMEFSHHLSARNEFTETFDNIVKTLHQIFDKIVSSSSRVS